MVLEFLDPAYVKSKLDLLDLSISSLRDALRGADSRTLTDLYNIINSVYSRLDVALSTRASESTLSALSGKFPSATALADNLSNPSTTIIGSAILGWDGTYWRRIAVDTSGRLRVVGDLRFDPTSTLNVNVVNADMFLPVYAQLIDADETQAQSITLDTGARSIVSVYAKADNATTFHLDGSNDSNNWFTDIMTYNNTTNVSDVVKTGFRYIILRSDASGVLGNKVTLVLASKVG